MSRRPHPRGSIIAYIWIVLITVGIVGATFFQDSDPKTDEGAGAGALIAIVGGVLTAVYIVLAKRLNSRNAAGDGGGEENVGAPPDTSWVRRNFGPLGAGAA